MEKINAYVAPGIFPASETIYNAVCQIWDIPREKLFARIRKREVVEPRQAAIYYQRTVLGIQPYIIERETGIDHSTVNYYERTTSNLINTDKFYRHRYERFVELVEQRVEL